MFDNGRVNGSVQENRPFDHHFGTLRGVRGFSDPRAVNINLPLQSGVAESLFLRKQLALFQERNTKRRRTTDRQTQFTWWIDKKNSHVVREDSATTSTIFTTIKLGQALPDKLFKFEPPARMDAINAKWPALGTPLETCRPASALPIPISSISPPSVLIVLSEMRTSNYAVSLRRRPATAFMPFRFASAHRFLAAREIRFLPSAERRPRADSCALAGGFFAARFTRAFTAPCARTTDVLAEVQPVT